MQKYRVKYTNKFVFWIKKGDFFILNLTIERGFYGFSGLKRINSDKSEWINALGKFIVYI